MSDALAVWGEQVERELRAEVLRFASVRAAVLWYAAARKRREAPPALGAEVGGAPISRERLDRVHATYARLSLCMLPVDSELDAQHGEALVAGWPDVDVHREQSRDALRAEAEARVANLAAWYLSTAERLQQRMADELDVSVRTLGRMQAYTERVLRRRMQARGLIPE